MMQHMLFALLVLHILGTLSEVLSLPQDRQL